jgi:hypothetical protein
MEAIRKIQTVKEGLVQFHLPKQFWGQKVEIIVLFTPPQKRQKKSLRGCLHSYANPSLMAYEGEAWQNAVREKHDHY